MKIISTFAILLLSFSLFGQATEPVCDDSLVVKCENAVNYPQRQKGNTFYGCWQAIIDSNYTELFFTNDNVYAYNKNGRDKKVLQYSITNSEIDFTEKDGENTHCTYTVESVEAIQFSCSFNFIWGGDTTVFNSGFKAQRIDCQYYTYDKVRCWGRFDMIKGCYIPSEDAVKYHKVFMERMLQYTEP